MIVDAPLLNRCSRDARYVESEALAMLPFGGLMHLVVMSRAPTEFLTGSAAIDWDHLEAVNKP